MEETDKAFWTEVFQDKPISNTSLEYFQTQLMAQIVAHPVDFVEEKRIAQRRQWGLEIAISLIIAGSAFGVLLWFERNIVFQWLNVLLVIMSGVTFASRLQQFGTRMVGYFMLLRELETGIGLLWGVVSWQILGVLSVLVLFRSTNQVYDEKPTI